MGPLFGAAPPAAKAAAARATQPIATGIELTVSAHMSRCGWLKLPAEAGKLLLTPRTRWRMQLREWDGKTLETHRADFRANASRPVGNGVRIPWRWPVDRLVVNTGQSLHTRLARCDHMNAPLDKSPVVRSVQRGGRGPPEGALALRCVSCQRMANRFDTEDLILTDSANGAVELQFTRSFDTPRQTLYDAVSQGCVFLIDFPRFH